MVAGVVAGPTHWPLTPNQMPSSSLIGAVQMPPISPRVWKPMAGYRPSSVPSS